MRWRRYLVLAVVVAGTLLGLAALARASARALADERAERIGGLLADQLASFADHARYLATLGGDGGDPSDSDSLAARVSTYLTNFRGLARFEVYDGAGERTLHVERFGDMVATLPAARLPGKVAPAPPRTGVAIGSVTIDVGRLERRPDRRRVVSYVARRRAGGVIDLTVYAEPFLAPLREQGARLLEPGASAPPDASVAGDSRWPVAVGVDTRPGPRLLLLALGVLVLALAAVVISERQLRAQERAALDRRLAAMEKLQSLGLLAAGVAHEINNPLEGIANWLKLGKIDKASEGFERIRAIVSDLLRFARPEEESGTADVAASCRRALELARFAKGFRPTDVDTSLPDGLHVCTSARTLEQVVLNVLLNAGAVSERVVLTAHADAARARIEIADSGPGIAPADLARVFDPFFSRSGGTGLGLSVSYGLVRAAGGDLRARNDEGGGARFIVELPLA